MLHLKINLSTLFLLSILCFSCGTNEGNKFPRFTHTSIDGVKISEKSFQGKTTVITVWATWCPPCIAKIDGLNQLKKKYTDVQFWAFNDESKTKVKAAVNRFDYQLLQFAKSDFITKKLQTRLVKTYPQYLIVNKDGLIVYDNTSESSNALKEIEEYLAF